MFLDGIDGTLVESGTKYQINQNGRSTSVGEDPDWTVKEITCVSISIWNIESALLRVKYPAFLNKYI